MGCWLPIGETTIFPRLGSLLLLFAWNTRPCRVVCDRGCEYFIVGLHCFSPVVGVCTRLPRPCGPPPGGGRWVGGYLSFPDCWLGCSGCEIVQPEQTVKDPDSVIDRFRCRFAPAAGLDRLRDCSGFDACTISGVVANERLHDSSLFVRAYLWFHSSTPWSWLVRVAASLRLGSSVGSGCRVLAVRFGSALIPLGRLPRLRPRFPRLRPLLWPLIPWLPLRSCLLPGLRCWPLARVAWLLAACAGVPSPLPCRARCVCRPPLGGCPWLRVRVAAGSGWLRRARFLVTSL